MQDLYRQFDYWTNAGPAHEPHLAETARPINSAGLRYVAFYLPQFHAIPENDSWWGPGFTEWTNVTKALPRYKGHYQPRLPADLGFYNLGSVDTWHAQAAMSLSGGIDAFCIHHYWFNGRRVLERPLDLLLENRDIPVRFFLDWANESWNRSWEGESLSILLEQKHSAEDDVRFIESILPALTDDRYFTVEGRPVLMLYRPARLPEPRATFNRWRERLTRLGLANPYIVVPQTFGVEDAGDLGADAAAGFPPHRSGFELPQHRHRLTLLDERFQGQATPYKKMASTAISQLTNAYVLHPGVCPHWDNEARKPGRGRNFYGSSPELYGDWLLTASRFAQQQASPDRRLVFINAWNEWAEGAYLEPDRHFGYAYLNETKRIKGVSAGSAVMAPARPQVNPDFTASSSNLNHVVNRLRNVLQMAAGS